MNAPETLNPEMPNAPEPLSTIQTIKLGQLQPSPTNPRKRFDQVKLNELAESMKVQGVLQPLLVREITTPNALTENELPRYEIIAGERRYRAATIAGLTDVPCFIRNLTDLQVLHAQVIENLQRDDLHPMEEADGYNTLMTDHAIKAEDLAAQVGKSRGYIYGRLKLCALVTETRDAFYNNVLDASKALLIARIPVAKLQVEALKQITEKNYYGETLSYRAARDLIHREYMTDLEKAIFQIKDAALLPKAGACTDCTKRTGNQPELFDDVKSKDVCTDTVCFAMKKTAHILVLQSEAEAKGHTVVTGKQANKILPHGDWNTAAGYAKLSAPCPHDEKGRSWEKVLGKKSFEPAKDTGKPAVQKTLVASPHSGDLIETINIEAAVKALREMGIETQPAKQSVSNDKEKAKNVAQMAEANTYRKKLFDVLHQQIEANLCGTTPTVAPGLYQLLADFALNDMLECHSEDEVAEIARAYLWPDTHEGDPIATLRERLPTLSNQQHFMLLVDRMMLDDRTVTWFGNLNTPPQTLLNVAKEIGIDAAAIEKEVAAEIKAAQKKTTSAPKKSAAKTKPKGGTA